MEFKLNKIDSDIRNKMQEEIKDNKVHSGKSISVKKDIKDENHEKQQQMKDMKKEEHEKRYILIDGIKYPNKNIDVNVEKVEHINGENSKGRVLDTTK